MCGPPSFFARPTTAPIPMGVQPALASWMGAGHRDQVRLEAFLTNAEELTRPQLKQLVDPLALSLDVGVRPATPLLDQRDLDNFALPLVTMLSQRGKRHFATVWVSKRHADTSHIGIGEATLLERRPAGADWCEIRTTASSAKVAFKQQIHDQLRDALALEEGPVALQLSFIVGPRRNWLNLWKPTIDALDPILGPSSPPRPWNPRDGRVVELGLHCRLDPTIGDDVAITVGARVLG